MMKRITALAAVAALGLGVAACGDDENDGGTQARASTPEPVAKIDSLTGRQTQVALDSGFVEALQTLKVTPAPVGDGEISSKGVASFPITGGNVTYYEPGSVSPFVRGRVDHDGSGLSLTADGKKVELTDFVVDPGRSVLTGTVTVDGEQAAASAPLFFLDGRTLEPLETDSSEGTATLQGTTVKLKAEAADLLNQTFGIDDLQAGLVVGVAKITVNAA